jgi:hypothetical protein
MAILRSVDGQFYEIPDDQLSKYLVPADKVKEKLGAAGADAGPPPDGGPPPSGGGPGPAIIVQIYGAHMPPSGPPPEGAASGQPSAEVQPYGGWWNTWRNTWRPHWHNWWHNWHGTY